MKYTLTANGAKKSALYSKVRRAELGTMIARKIKV
jgi:hypothetical protein